MADVFSQAVGVHLVRTCHSKHLSHVDWILSQDGRIGENLPWLLQRVSVFSSESKGIPPGESLWDLGVTWAEKETGSSVTQISEACLHRRRGLERLLRISHNATKV